MSDANEQAGPDLREQHAQVGERHHARGNEVLPPQASNEARYTVGAVLNTVDDLAAVAPELMGHAMDALGRTVGNYVLDSVAMSRQLIESQDHRLQTMVGHATRATLWTARTGEAVLSSIMYGRYRNLGTNLGITRAEWGKARTDRKIAGLSEQGVMMPDLTRPPAIIGRVHAKSAADISHEAKLAGKAFRWTLHRKGVTDKIDSLERSKTALRHKRDTFGAIREGVRNFHGKVEVRAQQVNQARAVR